MSRCPRGRAGAPDLQAVLTEEMGEDVSLFADRLAVVDDIRIDREALLTHQKLGSCLNGIPLSRQT